MDTPVIFRVLFNAFVIMMLAPDLGVFHCRSHDVKIKEALTWTFVWVFPALTFNLIIYLWMGQQQASEFFTGYLVEKALSVDSIFVFIMIFTYFQIPTKYQHKVLFWGIIGALIVRVILIFAGVALAGVVHRFWLLSNSLAIVLIFVGIKMILIDFYKIHIEWPLLFIATIISGSNFLSLNFKYKKSRGMSHPDLHLYSFPPFTAINLTI